MLKTCLVGLGSMGQHHARVLSELTNLIGICDSDNKKLEFFSKKYNVESFSDYDEMLKLKPDFVDIVVPTKLHSILAVQAIKENLNVLIEKPISDSLSSAKLILDEQEKNNVKILVGHIEHFNPAVMKIKEIIDSGLLGDILYIYAKRVGPFVPRIKDVGIILDSATHDIGVIRCLLGKNPSRVFAKHGGIRNDKGDYAIINMDFENAFATIEVNWLTPKEVRTLAITGTRGIAQLDYKNQEISIHKEEMDIIPKVFKEEPLKIEIKYFIDCIENDIQPKLNVVEAMKILEISEQVMLE